MSWRDTCRQLPCGGFWKNDRPPLDWPSRVCPLDRLVWRAVNLSRMTLFLSEPVVGKHSCSLLARKMSAKALCPLGGQGAGVIDCTVYVLPDPLRVKLTLSPVFSFARSTEGATANSIFIAGQLMAGIGP